METLKKYTIGELKQLAVYLEKFQGCAWIEPERNNIKQSCLEALNQMVIAKGPSNPEQYILRLRTVIRWFLDHGFRFSRTLSMINFEGRIRERFIFTITEDNINFEDALKRKIDINRDDINIRFMLPTTIIDNISVVDVIYPYTNIRQKYYTFPRFYVDDTLPDYTPPQPTPRPASVRPLPQPTPRPASGQPQNDHEVSEDDSSSGSEIDDDEEEFLNLTDLQENWYKSYGTLKKMINLKILRRFTTNCLRKPPITDELVTDETRRLECKICLTNKISVVLTNCGHTFCDSCTKRFHHKCAVCRTKFNRNTKARIFV